MILFSLSSTSTRVFLSSLSENAFLSPDLTLSFSSLILAWLGGISSSLFWPGALSFPFTLSFLLSDSGSADSVFSDSGWRSTVSTGVGLVSGSMISGASSFLKILSSKIFSCSPLVSNS